MRIVATLALAVTLLAGCSRDAADAPESGWTRLANGLRVCIRPIEGAKDVAVLTTFDIGSDHDPKGQSGLAHLVEHLYVTSAAGTIPARTAGDWHALHGSRCDATTQPDITTCHLVISPNELEAELADAAARLSDLRIEASDLERERLRVLEQIAEKQAAEPDQASLLIAFEHLRPGPHGARIVGSGEEVARISLEDVRTRVRRYYKPGNARRVIAGAVDRLSTEALVVLHFAGLAPGEQPPVPDESGPATPGTFEIDSGAALVEGSERATSVCVAYPGPNASEENDESAASFFFHLRSIRDQRSPELIVLPAPDGQGVAFRSFRQERPASEFVARVDELVQRFSAGPPTADEIAYVKGYLAGTSAKMSESLDRLAAWLSSAARSRLSADQVVESIQRLTQSDLEDYAAKWLTPERRVVVIVHGVAKTVPPEPARPAESERSTRLPALDLVTMVRVALTWDEAAQVSHRRIGDREFPDDAELEKAVTAARDAWVKKGKPDAPVMLVGDAAVPWDEVIKVVNVFKRCGIYNIEFAMGAPPKKPK